MQCLTNFAAYGTSCFGVFGETDLDSKTFDEAQLECNKYAGSSVLDVSLATLVDGYDSALLNVIMYAKNVDSAWIGFKKGSEVSDFANKFLVCGCSFYMKIFRCSITIHS